MATNNEIVNAAVTLIAKAAILAARFSGRARKRSLKRLASTDIDDKDKEIIFLRDKVYQQQIQITILQKGVQKKHTNKRYTLREKLFILCYMETFQIPRRRVKEKLGIAKSHSTDGCIKSKNRCRQESLQIKHRWKQPPWCGK